VSVGCSSQGCSKIPLKVGFGAVAKVASALAALLETSLRAYFGAAGDFLLISSASGPLSAGAALCLCTWRERRAGQGLVCASENELKSLAGGILVLCSAHFCLSRGMSSLHEVAL